MQRAKAILTELGPGSLCEDCLRLHIYFTSLPSIYDMTTSTSAVAGSPAGAGAEPACASFCSLSSICSVNLRWCAPLVAVLSTSRNAIVQSVEHRVVSNCEL